MLRATLDALGVALIRQKKTDGKGEDNTFLLIKAVIIFKAHNLACSS
jgi:hypothetical protein